MIYGNGVVHLLVVATDSGEHDGLAVEGRFGCDYSWNEDFTAYKCNQHRWRPGSDSSYLAYQAGDLEDDYREEPDGASFEATDVAGHCRHTPSVPDDDEICF